MRWFLRLSRSHAEEHFRRSAPSLVLFAAGLLTSLLFATTFFSREGDRPAREPVSARPDLVFVQARTVTAAGATERFPEGSRLVRFAPDRRSQGVTELTPDFFAVSDPEVSFDGSKLLFAGKASADSHWQIWEMKLDGTGKRQVTHCDGDCLRPAYMAHDQIVYTVIPPQPEPDNGQRPSNSQIYVTSSDGSDAQPITFGPGDFQVESVLQDGRILASARSPLSPAFQREEQSAILRSAQDHPQSAIRELYTLRPDGTSLTVFRPDLHPGVSRGDATELDDGSVVFVKTRSQGQAGGQLAVFRRGSLHNSPLGAVAEVYESPRRGSDDGLIVAKRQPSSAGHGARFDLYSFDVAHGRTAGTLFADPKLSSLDAVPVASHKTPRWYWSILNPQVKVGYFVCLDSRVSMDAASGRFPNNIVKVRVLALDAPSGSERVLGEAPVEADGSFYIAVPPDQPVRFETIDSGGKLVLAQRSWIWARSGEERGCVGCHDDKAVAGENAWPLALKRLDSPDRMGVGMGSEGVPPAPPSGSGGGPKPRAGEMPALPTH